MKTTDDNDPIDWRDRFHSLPSGTNPGSRAWICFVRVLLCIVLVVAGCLFLLMSGVFAGLSRGVGPEQTGGAIYVLFGLGINVVAGGMVALLTMWWSGQKSVARLVFYSFSAPAFVGSIYLAVMLIRGALRR